MLNNNSLKPIYVQLAEWTEDEILAGRLNDGDKIFSQNEYASFFNINAITAAKGVDILERKGIVEKRRGIGMFITKGAKERICKLRKKDSLMEIIDDMWRESKKLEISHDDLFDIIIEREKFYD